MSRVPALGPAASDAGVPPETPILGLPTIRRTALAARRAGFASVAVEDSSLPVVAALVGTEAEVGMPAPAGAVAMEWNRAVTVKDLEAVLAGAPPSSVGVLVATPADRARAEDHLLAALVKDTEGFMSRHVERKISLAVSRRLAATRVTPNAMTLFSVAIGLAGAAFFLVPTARMETIGALLFLLHSILDGCDGELARLKFQESRSGGVLDFWGDNVVHVAVFSAMALGWHRAAGGPAPLLLGALAVGGTLASALLVYARTMAPREAEGPLYTSVATGETTRLSRVADALSRRDFIYLVLILSAFGKAGWFLVLTAVGAPVYFLVLTAIALAERRPRSAS